ncbi:MAG: 2-oxo acid dehydrogenase subunit E2 [Myxococcales bacterium]|nr:2-oxo acid dehydrogenase subunit E2 [Myxococcales bacterium]
MLTRWPEPLPTWRKLALATWRPSDDPQIYGWLDLDATALLALVARLREETGVHVTLTHVVGAAVARAFRDCPDANAVASRRGLLKRSSVDLFFSVKTKGKGLTGTKLEGLDDASPITIAQRLNEGVTTIHASGDTPLLRSQRQLGALPSFLLRPAMYAATAVSLDLGLDLSRFGVPHDPFGTAVVTNIGTLGLERGLAPLIPTGRTAALFTVGKIHEGVVAVAGRPTVRPVLTLGATFDHRIVDGNQLGRLQATLRRCLESPAEHLLPEKERPAPEAQGSTTIALP